MFNLGRGALLDWDEAIYAEVSRGIVTSHHWFNLEWQHQPFFSKPPLSLWIEALSFQCFGATEFGARFGSALAGVAIVLLTYAIGRRLSGPAAGLFASFVLLTMNHFDRVMRQGTTDAMLCLSIYLAIYAYVRLREHDQAWLYIMCASIGVGAMIKGPAILVAPMAIGVDWLLRPERRFRIGFWRGCLGFVLILAIAAPWHIWMMLKSGTTFSYGYIGYLLAPGASQDNSGSSVGPFYYFRIILEGAFPWSLISIFAAAKWLHRMQGEHTLLWALAIVVVASYMLFPTKHQWYIIPVYPALAIEVGSFLAGVSENRRTVKYASVAVLAIGTIFAVIRLAIRQGDPFTNDVAQLATIAKERQTQKPLLIIARPQSELETPTAVFYSGRRATLLEIPSEADKITDELKTRSSADAIIQNDDVGYLSHLVDLHLVAQNVSLSYVVISKER
jgi:4-amino-4-deoxy-L-arabinose transferase-like glycosyltransferase